MSDPTQNTRNVIAACAAISVFGFAFGMTFPLLSLILESRGVETDMIGMNSAMMPIGILLFSSVIPTLTKRYGAKRIAIIAALVAATVMLSYKVFDTLAAWFLIRLVQGMAISTLFVLSESWIVGSAGDKNRGKVIAIYASILSASFGSGPLLISIIGIDGWTPFIIGSGVIFAGIIPFLYINENETDAPEETGASGIFSFASQASILLAAVGAFAIFDAATLSLFPVYGIRNGLDITTSANLVSALVLGNVILQFPIGWMADKFSYRRVLIGCAMVTGVMLVIFPFVIQSALRWPVLILMGTCGYGVYTVSLAALGSRFKGNDLVNGSASFAVMWGIGALLGTISGGWSMHGIGLHALPFSLAGVYLLLTILIKFNRLTKPAISS
jgi:MFS family permease